MIVGFKIVASPFNKLLNVNTELRPVLNQAQSLLALQQQFAAVAPAYLVESCSVLRLQEGVLTVAVRNATVAAKLRQLAPDLAQRLQQQGTPVSQLQIKVQLDLVAYRPPRPFRQLGPKARFALDELSEQLDDCPLKRALIKLGKGK